MRLALHSRYRRWLELALPMYSLALVFGYFFRPQALPAPAGVNFGDSLMPLAIWGFVGAMSGVLALSGLTVAFFLLYSPLYLLARSWGLVGKRRWVDKREQRFYTACFILLCFLGGLAVWNPLVAASIFVLLAGSAHLLWRVLA